MERYAHVTGWGMAVPERTLTNHDLAQMVKTSDEWITTRTGIRERHIAGPRETTASLALAAAQAALEVADLSPQQLDLIIVATATPDYPGFPATACLVQDSLGATHAGACDLSAACTGFIYGLSLGAQVIRAGAMQNVLVIGADTLSRTINWQDRATCILFGDGAGAFVLQGSETPGGLLTFTLRSDGSGANMLAIPAGGSRLPHSQETLKNNLHLLHMDGKEVYRYATRVMAATTRDVIRQAGLTTDDVALVIPHQANLRIIDSAARALNMPLDKFFVNLDRYGNTSAASIPIAICEAVAQNRIHPNDHLVLVGFGAGLTWGGALLKWNVTVKPEISPWHRLGRRLEYELAKVRSTLRRRLRHMESIFYGSQSPEVGKEPPPKRKGGKS